IFLMGVGPLIAWRRATRRNLLQIFAAPAIFGVVIGLAALTVGIREWYALSGFSLAAFAFATVISEFKRGVVARGHMVNESPQRAARRVQKQPLCRVDGSGEAVLQKAAAACDKGRNQIDGAERSLHRACWHR